MGFRGGEIGEVWICSSFLVSEQVIGIQCAVEFEVILWQRRRKWRKRL